MGPQPEGPQTVQHVETGEACSDDDGVELFEMLVVHGSPSQHRRRDQVTVPAPDAPSVSYDPTRSCRP